MSNTNDVIRTYTNEQLTNLRTRSNTDLQYLRNQISIDFFGMLEKRTYHHKNDVTPDKILPGIPKKYLPKKV